MSDLSRRNLLRTGGTLGAVGAMTLAAPTRAWTWSSAGSIAGTGTGRDPRFVWDDLADPVVKDLLETGGVPGVNDLLESWTRNNHTVPAGLPASVKSFINQAKQLPAWVDFEKLETAFRFTVKRGLYLGVLYGMNSGMMSAAIPREARAVWYSKGGADIQDRIAKTAKLGYDIGDYHAYHPDGEMIVTCVKTRLVHAAVRHLLPQSGHWVASADEQVPISQFDIMVTWHSLASSVWQKLLEWKVPITSREAAAYLHLWQVTAHMLGVNDEYIPNSWDEALLQREQVLVPLLAPTPEGVMIAEKLVRLGDRIDWSLLTKPAFESVTRYMLGDTVTGYLELGRNPVLDEAVELAWIPFVRVREFGLLLPGAPALYWMFDELLRRFALFYLEPFKKINIDIPTMNNPNYP